MSLQILLTRPIECLRLHTTMSLTLQNSMLKRENISHLAFNLLGIKNVKVIYIVNVLFAKFDKY